MSSKITGRRTNSVKHEIVLLLDILMEDYYLDKCGTTDILKLRKPYNLNNDNTNNFKS